MGQEHRLGVVGGFGGGRLGFFLRLDPWVYFVSCFCMVLPWVLCWCCFVFSFAWKLCLLICVIDRYLSTSERPTMMILALPVCTSKIFKNPFTACDPSGVDPLHPELGKMPPDGLRSRKAEEGHPKSSLKHPGCCQNEKRKSPKHLALCHPPGKKRLQAGASNF